MKHSRSFQSNLPTLIAVLLMLVMVILLFTPYWHFDGQSASINAYVWLPFEQGALETYLEAELGEAPELNSFVGAPILLLVLGILGIAIFLWKPDALFTPLIAVAFGATGVFGYLRSSILKLGGLWGLHVALCAVILLLGIASCLAFAKSLKNA